VNDQNSEFQLALLQDAIRASNRTTHAVRALVRFLFIQLAGYTLAAFVIGASLGAGATEGILLGAFISLLSLAFAFAAGWSELRKSDVPPVRVNTAQSRAGAMPPQQSSDAPLNFPEGDKANAIGQGASTTEKICDNCGAVAPVSAVACVECDKWLS
jgi:ribosomal protein L40E